MSAALSFRLPSIQSGSFNRAQKFLQINHNEEKRKAQQLPFSVGEKKKGRLLLYFEMGYFWKPNMTKFSFVDQIKFCFPIFLTKSFKRHRKCQENSISSSKNQNLTLK